MAKLYLSEIKDIRAVGSGSAQVASVGNDDVDMPTLDFTAGIQTSGIFGDDTKLLRVCSDATCFIAINDAPVAVTDKGKRLPADVVEYFGVKKGDKISVIA